MSDLSNNETQKAIPTLIITAGSTGSGKTKLIDKTTNYIGKEPGIFKQILIDDIVENNPYYKAEVLNIINKVCPPTSGIEERKACLTEKFNTPTTELFDKFKKAYFATRTGENCVNPDKPDKPSGSGEQDEIKPDGDNKMICNQLNDTLLKKSFEKNENIVLETTGQYIPSWVLTNTEEEKWVPGNYEVVFSYSLVNVNNLIKRNKSRALTSVLKFLEDQTNPAPRLPDVSKEAIETNVKKMIDNLITLYEVCINNTDTNTDTCGNKKIDQLLIFDNNDNNDEMKLIFDSKANKVDTNEFIKIVNTALVVPNSTSSVGGYDQRSDRDMFWYRVDKRKATAKKRKATAKKRKITAKKRKITAKKRKTKRRKY
jgi:hypothetical protein